jgi:hypothetical protein
MRSSAGTDILVTVIVIVSWCGIRTGAAVVSGQIPWKVRRQFGQFGQLRQLQQLGQLRQLSYSDRMNVWSSVVSYHSMLRRVS